MLASGELSSLIGELLPSENEGGTIRYLSMGNAQTLIDTIDEARPISACHLNPTDRD